MLTATLRWKHCDSELVTCTELFDLEIVFSVHPDEEDAIADPAAEAGGCLGKFGVSATSRARGSAQKHLDSFVTSGALKAAVQMKIAD